MPAAILASAQYESDLARVRLDFAGLQAGTTALQVIRRDLDSGRATLVRGARAISIANPATASVRLYDYEFPAGAEIRYEYTQGAADTTVYPVSWTQLVPAEADFEGGLSGGWYASAGDTILSTTAVGGYIGASALRLESVGTDTVEARLTQGVGAQSDMTCLPGTQYRVAFASRAGATSRGTQLGVNWFTSAGVYLATDVVFLTDLVGSWSSAAQTFTSPATAGRYELFLQVLGPVVNTERHYFDGLVFGPLGFAPDVEAVWLKHVLRPYLNGVVTVRGFTPAEHVLRAATYPVVGRNVPLGRGDARAGRTFTVDLDAPTPELWQRMDDLLAVGGVWYWQPPSSAPALPRSSYVMATAASEAMTGRVHSGRRIFTFTLAEVAPPAADSTASGITWQAVLDAYPTWADLLAAKATWGELLSTFAAPAEVVVP